MTETTQDALQPATRAVVEELGLIWPDEAESMHEDVARAVLKVRDSQIREVLDQANALDPADFKTGQDHLSPAFREINFHDAFHALVKIVIEAQELVGD